MANIRKRIIGVFIVLIALCSVLFAGCSLFSNSASSSDSAEYTIIYAYEGTTYTITVKHGDVWSLPLIPVKEGYTFLGLYDAEEGGTQYASSSGVGVTPFYDDSNLVLYPQFTAVQYTVMLNYGESFGTTDSVIADYDGSIPNLPKDLTIAGKGYMTFKGWYTEANGGGIQVAGSDGVCLYSMDSTLRALCSSSNVLKLYAYFESQVYTISYTYNGDTVSTEVTHGGSWSLEVPVKEGYTFDGFYDAETGGTQYAGADGAGLEAFVSDNNLVLYPHFTIITYTLTLDYGEGSGYVTSVNADYDGTIPNLPAYLSVTGKTFVGWYTAADGSGIKVAGDDGKALVTMDADMRAVSDSSNRLTLYAYFKINTYTVTLYNADGSEVLSSVIVDYGTDISAVSEGIEGDGRIVTSWHEDGVTEAFSGEVTKDLSLYALTYAVRVTFDANGGEAVSSITVDYGESVTLPSTTNGVYNLIYWYDSDGNKYTDTITPDVNITLTAYWLIFIDGEGTETAPYLIGTAAQLAAISSYNAYNVHFALTNDIDYNNAKWTPITTFYGVLDGQGYTISNFYIDTSSENTGFAETNYGTICNLTISGATVKASRQYDVKVGALAGVNNGTIDNCSVVSCTIEGYAKETSNQSSDHARYAVVGGMVGKNSGTISNCTVTTSKVYGDSERYDGNDVGGSSDIAVAYVGGLVGEVASGGSVTGCEVTDMYSISGYGYFRCWHLFTQSPYIKVVVGGVIGIAQSGSSYSECTSDMTDSSSILSATYSRVNDGAGSKDDNCSTYKGGIYGIDNS